MRRDAVADRPGLLTTVPALLSTWLGPFNLYRLLSIILRCRLAAELVRERLAECLVQRGAVLLGLDHLHRQNRYQPPSLSQASV